jgi:transcriptional regulator with XRE-family HTH domain
MTKSCHCCNGTGLAPDEAAIGKSMVRRRKAAGLTQKDVAKKLGISVAFLCQLENGQRHWTSETKKDYVVWCALATDLFATDDP